MQMTTQTTTKDTIRFLYTSFDGRLRRRNYWLGLLGIVGAAIVLGIVLSAIVGPSAAGAIGNLLLLYPVAALMTKRLHDRDKALNPWLFVFLGVPLLVNLMQATGIGFAAVATPDGSSVVVPTGLLGTLASGIAFAVALWALVELGFLRGTVGPNRFGPDPHGDAAAR